MYARSFERMMTDGSTTSATKSPVLFDMDGVLIHGRATDPAVYVEAGDAVIDELDLSPTADQRALLQEHRCDETVATVCEDLGTTFETFWRRKESHASRLEMERIKNGERPLFDDADAIHDLARDRKLAVVSNNRDETVQFVTSHYGFDDAFDYVRGRDATPDGYHRRKPDPYYIQDALDHLDADEGYYVGDRPKDILAANNAGLDGIFLRRSFNRDVTPEHDPRYVIESLDELPVLLSE